MATGQMTCSASRDAKMAEKLTTEDVKELFEASNRQIRDESWLYDLFV